MTRLGLHLPSSTSCHPATIRTNRTSIQHAMHDQHGWIQHVGSTGTGQCWQPNSRTQGPKLTERYRCHSGHPPLPSGKPPRSAPAHRQHRGPGHASSRLCLGRRNPTTRHDAQPGHDNRQSPVLTDRHSARSPARRTGRHYQGFRNVQSATNQHSRSAHSISTFDQHIRSAHSISSFDWYSERDLM